MQGGEAAAAAGLACHQRWIDRLGGCGISWLRPLKRVRLLYMWWQNVHFSLPWSDRIIVCIQRSGRSRPAIPRRYQHEGSWPEVSILQDHTQRHATLHPKGTKLPIPFIIDSFLSWSQDVWHSLLNCNRNNKQIRESILHKFRVNKECFHRIRLQPLEAGCLLAKLSQASSEASS